MPEIAIVANHVAYDPNGNRHDDLLDGCDKGYVDGWTCKKTARKGDLYLFYFCRPLSQISAVGVCASRVVEEANVPPVDWTDAPKLWSCRFKPLVALRRPIDTPAITSHPDLAKWWRKRPFQGRPRAIAPRFAYPLLDLVLRENPKLKKVLTPYLKCVEANGDRRTKGAYSAANAAERSGSAIDKDEPPDTVETTGWRVIRDTAEGNKLKDLYEDACQICGETVRVPPSKGSYYSEVHHLRPLGGGHCGIDAWKNMIVVCPTCHAELDYLAIAIEPKSRRIVTCAESRRSRRKHLTLHEDHPLDRQNLKYHWNLFEDARRSERG